MTGKNIRKLVLAALLAALTAVATMIIRIPTPTQGYIHLGDGMVLICGILLGPGLGALAAGIGSMMAGPSEATAIGNLMAQMIGKGEFAGLMQARACVAESFPIRAYQKG